MKTSTLLLLLLFIVTTIDAHAIEIANQRLKIKHNDGCYIPYLSNMPIDKDNSTVTHLIIAIHSSNHDAYMVYNSCKTLLEQCDKQKNNVIIMAPQFLMEKHLECNTENNLLYWKASPFYGSSISTAKCLKEDLRISAYGVIEDIISDFCNKEHFQNLNRITILGHSAGGQMVNRFAASNTIEFTKARPRGIAIKYIVMNPSSYIYFSPKRPVDGTKKFFAIPTEKQIAQNANYNNYSYGLNKLYSYHRKRGITAKKMKELYPRRNVAYLLGQKDCVADIAMSKHPFAMMQGRNRLERGRNYYAHLIDEFGIEIVKNQKLSIIKGVGHSGRNIILSSFGRVSILK